MKYQLIFFIIISVGLHVVECIAPKGKQIISIVSLILHIAIIFAFLFLQLALTDLFAFLLCSIIAELLLKLKGRKNGI